jgi:hypothetical protein
MLLDMVPPYIIRGTPDDLMYRMVNPLLTPNVPEMSLNLDIQATLDPE